MSDESKVPESIKPWVENLALALQIYIEEQGIPSRTQLANRIGVPERQFRYIAAGDKFLHQSVEIYAEIYSQLGIKEADPRQIPVLIMFDPRIGMRTTKPMAWSEERYQDWLAAKNPTVVSNDVFVEPMVGEKEQEDLESIVEEQSFEAEAEAEAEEVETIIDPANQVVNDDEYELLKAGQIALGERINQKLQAWMSKNWRGTKSDFAELIGLNTKWFLRFLGTDHIADSTEAYAKLYRLTNISDLDPRTLPPRLRALPRGGFMTTPRAWTEEEYQAWCLKQDQPSQVIDAVGDLVMPATTEPSNKSAMSELVVSPKVTTNSNGLSAVSAIEQMVEALKDSLVQIVERVGRPEQVARSEEQTPIDQQAILSRLDDLVTMFEGVERIELKMDTLVSAVHRSATQPPPDIERVSISVMMQELHRRLIKSKTRSRSDRDRLAEIIAPLAGVIIPYLNAYAQATPEKREAVLESIKELV